MFPLWYFERWFDGAILFTRLDFFILTESVFSYKRHGIIFG